MPVLSGEVNELSEVDDALEALAVEHGEGEGSEEVSAPILDTQPGTTE